MLSLNFAEMNMSRGVWLSTFHPRSILELSMPPSGNLTSNGISSICKRCSHWWLPIKHGALQLGQLPAKCPLPHPVAKRQRWHWPGWSPPWHQSPSWRAESPWTQRTKPPEHSNFRDLSPAPVRPVNYKKLGPRCPKMSQIHLKSWVQTSRQARNQRFSPETVRLPGQICRSRRVRKRQTAGLGCSSNSSW